MAPNSASAEGFNFTPIDTSDIPASVQAMLLARARLRVPELKAPRTLVCYTDTARCEGIHGTTIYRGGVVKEYERGVEHTIQFVEADTTNRVVGRGEVRFEPAATVDFFKDKPFVGGTFTEERRRGEGLGRYRLLAMGDASCRFGLPLHSGTIFLDPSARHMWRELVAAGVATQYMQEHEGEYRTERFRFNHPVLAWPVDKTRSK